MARVVRVLWNPAVDARGAQRSSRNKPEKRAELIRARLDLHQRQAGGGDGDGGDHKKDGEVRFEVMRVDENVPELERELERVHDPGYLHFLRHAYDSWRECGFAAGEADFEFDGGLVPYHFARRDQTPACPELPTWKRCGFYADDRITPIQAATWEKALRSANNSLVAVRAVAAAAAPAGPPLLFYCLNESPGHHSFRDGYGGYCFLNNGALAAAALRAAFPDERVAVLDLDYHGGNGTESIFRAEARVLTVSIHADPAIEYPSYFGSAHETDKDLSIPLPKGTALPEYMRAVDRAVAKVRAFGATHLVIPFGGDSVRDDPEASPLAGFCLDPPDYAAVSLRIVTSLPLLRSVIVTQEGGYHMGKIADVVYMFLVGLAGRG